ncbi:MAG TPA: DUF2779 domain-containing protein [Bacilli bacterium]|nr:DUF2779 domain-containing protein [Bacilli bacterium]
MNRISKSTFLKYLRCPRAAYFESLTSGLVRDYHNSLANATSEEQARLLKAQFDEKLREFLIEKYQQDDEDDEDEEFVLPDLLKEDKMLALMNETYFSIEELAAKRAHNLYGGQVIAGQREGEHIYGQKLINLFEDGFNFFTFVDTLQIDERLIRLIETKATTSRKFLKLAYKHDKEEQAFFVMTPEGNLVLREEIAGLELHPGYFKKREHLFNRNGDHGRYVYDLAWQRYVYEMGSQQPDKAVKYYLAVLNADYIYDGRVDEAGQPLYDENQIITLIDLSKITEEYMPLIAKDFALVKERVLHPNGEVVNLGKDKCLYGKNYRECPWLGKCKGDLAIPAKNSIFMYLNGHHGFKNSETDQKYSVDELLEMGIINALAINYNWLSKTQKVQYKVLESGETYIDKDFIKAKLKNLKYPLYHLDFETMNYPLPRFKGERPYQQSVFQFSLHLETKPGEVDKEVDQVAYLASGSKDEREALVKALIKAIPDNHQGQVVTYNQGFEKGRLKELAQMFPRYAKALNAIIERTIDLMHFFKPNEEIRKAYFGKGSDKPNITYYHIDLQRSYSIKKVLPIFVPQLDYANLAEVHNGIDAQLAYLKLPSLSKEEFATTYANMLEYCKQDTWAMVEILKALRTML